MSQKKQLGELLVEAGIITAKTLERALERQQGSGSRLGTVLEEMGVITDEELASALAAQFDMKLIRRIRGNVFPRELFDLVPVDLALQRTIFPLREKDGILALAVANPFDSDTFDYLGKKLGLKIVTAIAPTQEIVAAIKEYYLEGKEPEQRQSRLVLIVEDSPPVATVTRVALEKEGYKVIQGHDGIEGLKLALEQRPDLIICDSVMPRMDGFGLLRALRGNQVTASIPVILLTSKASPEEEQKALAAGFHDFIAKPAQPIRIVSRVKRAFELLATHR
jgi:CheY-like chemotaxis protein